MIEEDLEAKLRLRTQHPTGLAAACVVLQTYACDYALAHLEHRLERDAAVVWSRRAQAAGPA